VTVRRVVEIILAVEDYQAGGSVLVSSRHNTLNSEHSTEFVTCSLDIRERNFLCRSHLVFFCAGSSIDPTPLYHHKPGAKERLATGTEALFRLQWSRQHE